MNVLIRTGAPIGSWTLVPIRYRGLKGGINDAIVVEGAFGKLLREAVCHYGNIQILMNIA